MILSTIRIPVNRCCPILQRALRMRRLHSPTTTKRRTRRAKYCLSIWTMFILICACRIPSAAAIIPIAFFLPALRPTNESSYFALPGCDFALVSNPSPDDVYSDYFQESMKHKAVNSIVSSNSTTDDAYDGPICLPADSTPDASLKSTPTAFVVDTDSSAYLLDTGANRVIVNDRSLLQNFTLGREGVKGLGGAPIMSGGSGVLNLPLSSDDGHKETAIFNGAIYCPTSPFNLLPPQILTRTLKKQYGKARVIHDDEDYCLEWTDSTNSSRVTSLQITSNDLFILNTAPLLCHLRSAKSSPL